MLWVSEMPDLGFEKNDRMVIKIIQVINRFCVSLVELKTRQKKLGAKDLEGNYYNNRKEILNAWLHLQHNKNLALMELQRSRAT